MTRIMIVIASVRSGRAGRSIGDWVASGFAGRDVEVDVADLAELNLPLDDEPNHPRARAYTQPHTIAWSERVDAADAFVFVTPEYNFSFPASLKNALDHLAQEWAGKHAAFVSYGGVSGGVRAVTSLAPVLQAFNLVWTQSVSLAFPGKQIANGVFAPTEQQTQALGAMIDNLQPLAAKHAAERG